MPKHTFIDYLCRPWCTFFKEGAKEDMACQGARVVEHLVTGGRIAPAEIPPLKKNADLWNAYREELDGPVCGRCSFRSEDCDFRSEAPPDNGEPCGGFILLAHLRKNGLIDESDIEGCCEE